MDLKSLPIVKKIMGASLDLSMGPRTSTLTVQYKGVDGVLYDIKMPFLDGMYLLNILKQAKADSGFDIPEESKTN